MLRMGSSSKRLLVCAIALSSARAMAIIDTNQGTRLHGTGDYEHVNIFLAQTDKPDCLFTVVNGELKAAGNHCSGINGTTFTAPYGGGFVSFRIENTKPHVSTLTPPGGSPPVVLVSPPGSEYMVTVRRMNSGPWKPLCGGQGALAVPYGWSKSGELLADPRYFTFACVPKIANGIVSGGSVIAKCIDWGYPPWGAKVPLNPRLDTTLSSYDDHVARRFHQTCVRLAMADYCGEGLSNTLDNTPVSVADISSMATDNLITTSANGRSIQLANPNGSLEAVWGFDGCGRARVLCLSRARWNTLSLAATCLDRVMAQRIGTLPVSDGRGCAQSSNARPSRCVDNLPVHPTLDQCQSSCADCEQVLNTAQGGAQGSVYRCLDQASRFPSDDACLAGGCSNCAPVPQSACGIPPEACDDWDLADLQREEATLVSYSTVWDRSLVSFVDSKGRRLTKSRVEHPFPFASNQPDDSHGFVVDDQVFGATSGFKQARYEGRVYAISIPQSVRASVSKALVPLYRCKLSEGPVPAYLMTTLQSSSGQVLPGGTRCGNNAPLKKYVVEEAEGYIYSAKPDDVETVPLYLWKNKDGYATSSAEALPGFQKVNSKPLGHLPMRSRLAY